jgi:hypothetical protein
MSQSHLILEEKNGKTTVRIVVGKEWQLLFWKKSSLLVVLTKFFLPL